MNDTIKLVVRVMLYLVAFLLVAPFAWLFLLIALVFGGVILAEKAWKWSHEGSV